MMHKPMIAIGVFLCHVLGAPQSFLLADEGNGAIHRVTPGNASLTWTIALPGNRDMQLIGGNKLLANYAGGFREYNLSTGAQLKNTNYTAITPVNSIRRLNDGRTLVAGNGNNSVEVAFLSTTGVEQKRVSIPLSGAALRLMRFTDQGHILFGTGNRVYEYDSTGKGIRNIPVTTTTGAQITVYKVVKRSNGTLWASTGYAKTLVEISATGVIKELVADATTQSNFYGDFQILSTGNYFGTDWWGHGAGNGGKGAMLREFDTLGKEVWKFQNAVLASSIHGAIVLDGLNLNLLHDDFDGQQLPQGVTGIVVKMSTQSRLIRYDYLQNNLLGRKVPSCFNSQNKMEFRSF